LDTFEKFDFRHFSLHIFIPIFWLCFSPFLSCSFERGNSANSVHHLTPYHRILLISWCFLSQSRTEIQFLLPSLSCIGSDESSPHSPIRFI
jgi:hypothetical protein